MGELLKHELFKIYSRKVLWFAIAFFFVITLLFVHNMASMYTDKYGDMNEYYHSIYESHEGVVNENDIKSSQSILDSLHSNIKDSKSNQSTNTKPSLDSARKINYAESVQNAKANQDMRTTRISEYKSAVETAQEKYGTNSFAYRDAVLRYSMISTIRMPGIYFTYPWNNIIDFSTVFGFLIIVAMTLLGVSPIFSDEYETGMDSLILSSKNGKGKAVGAKVLSCIIYCAVISLIFVLVNAIGYFVALGTTGFNAPIQSIYNYLASPYNLTIGQYFIVQTATLTLGSIAFGIFTLFISALSKNALIPFFTCGCVIGITAGIKAMDITLPGIVSWIVDFSYSELIRVKGLFSTYKTYDIFGHPILYANLIILTFLIVTVIIIGITFKVFKNHEVK